MTNTPRFTNPGALCLPVAFAVLAFASVAAANPYASGIAIVANSNSTNVQFILNENASSVIVTLYNGGGSSTNNLGALNKGLNSFPLGTNTSYAISVFNIGAGTPFQTTTTASNTTSYYAPRGVAVNQNPGSTNFGRIYVANSESGDYTNNAPAGGTRTTTVGLYVINADQSDAFGYGAAGQVPSPMVLGGSSTYSPAKMFVGPDDMLYVADGDGTYIGGATGCGLWMVNPALTSATKLFNQVSGSSGASNELGGVVATPYVTGSYARSNLVIQAMPWDKYAGEMVLQYDIAHSPLPYTGAFTTNVSDLFAGYAGTNCDLAVGQNGYYYLLEQNPGAGSAAHPCVEVVDSSGNVLWNSFDATSAGNAGYDAYNYVYSIAVSPDQQWMATLNINEQIQVTPLTNGIPNYSTNTLGCPPHLGYNLTNGGAIGRALCFDAADNIYACSGAGGPSRLNILSLDLTTTCVTYNDWTGTNGTFSLVISSNPPAAPPGAGSALPIIPQPKQMQIFPGTFTLCPSPAVPGAPALASLRILTDAPSSGTGQYLAARLFQSTGFRFALGTNPGGAAVKNAILLTTVNANTNLGAEGYELTVAPDSVVVRAPAQAGLFYGVQSLLQLLPPQVLSLVPVRGVAWTAPCVYIYDSPRFPWRGWMLDVSRHFLGKDDVKTFLDIMALHKLNTLHLHLVDDQGWRVEILAYPLLTQIGAWRTNIDFGQNPRAGTPDNAAGQYGGYYTQNDIREIVAYAQERYINVVPEIEMPSHTTASLASYPQYGCGNPVGDYSIDGISTTGTSGYGVDLYSLAGTNNTAPGTNTYAFLEEVLTEVMGLFPSQYIHCGGDEVVATEDKQWTTYAPDVAQMAALGITGTATEKITAYQYWFSTNIAAFLRANGRTMVGWTGIEAAGIVTNAILMDAETGSSSEAVETAEAGQYVVMAPETNCYVNYYMTTNVAVEPYFEVGNAPGYVLLNAAYSFEPIPAGLPAQYDSFILGAEGTEFAEFIPGLRNVEFKALPRMCALAEVMWTQAAAKNYTNFLQRLATHEQWLAQMGANYDQTNAIPIGAWSSPVSTNATTVNYNITGNVTQAGEIDVSFDYTTGSDGLWIYSAALLVNGVPVDSQTFTAFSGAVSTIPTSGLPVFVLHLANFEPGATYTIQASIAGAGGTNSNGTVYLTNWN